MSVSELSRSESELAMPNARDITGRAALQPSKQVAPFL
jgi:hypothetical protein